MLRLKQSLKSEKLTNGWLSSYILSRNPECDYSSVPKTERRLALLGLVFSLTLLASKVLFTHHQDLRSFIFEKRLVTYETISADGEVVLRHAWTTVVKYSRFWFPVVCGFCVTWFTWLMVYLDSSVPGIQPPSPLSPSKYRLQSGHTFHLNYIFAVLVGSFVSIYMYIKGVSLQL